MLYIFKVCSILIRILNTFTLRYNRCTSDYFTVIILDVNEHSPIFDKSEYQVAINENLTVGQTIISVNAKDYDDINGPSFFNNEVSVVLFKVIKCLLY